LGTEFVINSYGIGDT